MREGNRLVTKGTYAKMARGDMVKFLVPHSSTPKRPPRTKRPHQT